MRCLALLVALAAAASNAPSAPSGFPSRTPTTGAPTVPPTPFLPPKLPISKAKALYPQCRVELFFAIDVSGSVAKGNQKIMFTFVDEMIVAVEENIADGRYGVVVFGIDATPANYPAVTFTYSNISKSFNGPYGNGKSPSTEVFFGLDHLRYNCTECFPITPAWSQLEMLFAVVFDGDLTPTWDALDMIQGEYVKFGDPTVPSRFIILVTDGVPNDNACYDTNIDTSACVYSLNMTNNSVATLKDAGTLLITVGMGLVPATQALMYFWASPPRDILAIPLADYNLLQSLIPQLLAVMCPQGHAVNCLDSSATFIDISGSNFLNTGEIVCAFTRKTNNLQRETTAGIWERDDLIRCPLPQTNFFPGTWDLTYSQDGGRGFQNGTEFKWGTVCQPELLVIWWPFCALALLPLAFCRPARAAPVKQQRVARGVARPAPAATEEYEEYEEVEEIVAPPQPVNKWKVAPTAYLGFGRARMSVDWAGVAPESAPHEGVRKKVVKKVVTDTAPVPTAGPATTPQPAQQQYEEEPAAPASRPPVVEEPDWVNSCLDRVAAIFCFCCVKKH